MAKTKISEWSTTPASNTDIDGINIAEGCAPSGINDAIRDLMSQVRSWQSGASGDPFNGPMNGTIGATTAYSGAFTTVSATGVITSTLATGTAPLTIASTTKVTNLNADLLDSADWASPAALGSTTPAAVSATTLSASGTVSGTGFSNYLASPPAIGGTTAAAGSFTTLTTSSTVTLNGGTANGVTYLNGSKVLTSGSALTFNGSTLATSNANASFTSGSATTAGVITSGAAVTQGVIQFGSGQTTYNIQGGPDYVGNVYNVATGSSHQWAIAASEQMRLTSTGLGIGTSSPNVKLQVQAGTVLVETTASNSKAQILLGSAGANYGQIQNDSTGVWSLGYGAGYSALGTPVLTWNSSGNVGIGTSSPNRKLEINQSSAGGEIGQFISNTGASTSGNTSSLWFGTWSGASTTNVYNAKISAINMEGLTAKTDLAFYTYNGSGSSSGVLERMRLDSAGNLGLGVTPSAWTLAPAFELKQSGVGLWNSGSNDFYISSNAYYNSGWKYGTSSVAVSQYRQNSGTHQWFNAASGTAGNAISFTQAMTLDASGNLLVGSTGISGNGKLHVKGADGTSGNEYRGLTVASTTTEAKSVNIAYDSANDVGVIAASQYATGWKNLALCPAGGNLLVGTTSTFNTSRATFTSQANNTIAAVQGTTGGYCFVSSALTNGGTFYHASFTENGTQRGSITSNGTITVYNTTSDYRLKTVVGSVTGHGERIDALEPIEYTWNSNGSRTRGFLAHKFQEVYADSVTGEKDAVDSDGNPVYQAMQASSPEVIADLVAEIQSLRQRVAQLETN